MINSEYINESMEMTGPFDCCKDCSNMPNIKVEIPCCPILYKCCDKQILDFYYRARIPYKSDSGLQILYEVTFHYQLERCFRSYSPGDIAYTTTLLPGETVKLFSNDRRTSFTIDSDTQTAVRQAAFSEESHYLYDVASSVSNININDLNTNSTSTSQSGSNWQAGGSAGLDLGFISIGGGGGGGGSSSNSNSLTTILHQLNQHSQSSSRRAQINVNSSSSISIGEVQTRTHASGQSEDIYESTSRTISNPNKCHAVTFYFYRINKCYVSRYKLADVHFRILIPGAFNSLIPKPLKQFTGLTITPVPVLATSSASLNTVVNSNNASNVYINQSNQLGMSSINNTQYPQPIEFTPDDPPVDKYFAIKVIQAAIGLKESELIKNLINSPENTVPSTIVVNEEIWCHDLSLASPGVTVKGCLDKCNICENSEQTDNYNKYIDEMNKQKLELRKGKVKLLSTINDLLISANLADITPAVGTALSTIGDIIRKSDECISDDES
jgi:hypothetical protein